MPLIAHSLTCARTLVASSAAGQRASSAAQMSSSGMRTPTSRRSLHVVPPLGFWKHRFGTLLDAGRMKVYCAAACEGRVSAEVSARGSSSSDYAVHDREATHRAGKALLGQPEGTRAPRRAGHGEACAVAHGSGEEDTPSRSFGSSSPSRSCGCLCLPVHLLRGAGKRK